MKWILFQYDFPFWIFSDNLGLNVDFEVLFTKKIQSQSSQTFSDQITLFLMILLVKIFGMKCFIII